jgi:hypothetical protein
MNPNCGGVLLGQVPAEKPHRVLVDPTGSPLTTSLKAAEQQRRARLAAAVSAAGAPLFPYVDVPPVWADEPPGRALFDVLAGTDPAALDDFDLVELLKATGRAAANVEAMQVRVLAELARRPRYARCAGDPGGRHEHDSARAAADEASAAMQWTPRYADSKVNDALNLAEKLPATLRALHEGRIDAYRARVIAEETVPLADRPGLLAEVEAKLLGTAGAKTGPQVRAHAKKVVLAVAPEVAEQRRKKARRSRGVDKPYECGNGMGQLGITGPIEGLAAFWLAVDAAARARHTAASKATSTTGAGDAGNPSTAEPAHGAAGAAEMARADVGKTLDQLRFDVLADLGWSALQAGHLGCCSDNCGTSQRLGTRHGKPAQINVTVPLSTLLGASELPGELHGFGPITAHTARTIAADGTWRRLLTDPATGALLDYGRTTYTPPQPLREHVIARDRTCRFPPCDIDADRADIDHSTPAADGGHTSELNTGPLHRRHHNSKTLHAWRLRQDQPGHYLWISPANHIYEIEPETIDLTLEFDQYEHQPTLPTDPDPPPF